MRPGIFLGHADDRDFRYDAYFDDRVLILVYCDIRGSATCALKSLQINRPTHPAWKKALALYEGFIEDPSISPTIRSQSI